MLKGMQVIKQYSVGTRLFEAPSPEAGRQRVLMPGIPWGVTVYYDPPKPQLRQLLSKVQSDDHLLMTFDAKLAGINAFVGTSPAASHTAQAVSDTAATHCFVSRAWIQRASAHVTPLAADDSAALADGSAMRIYGTSTLKITLGPYSGRVKAYVTDLASHHDLILGEDWLKQHAATICYHKNALLLRQGTRTYTVNAKRWVNPLKLPVNPFLSAVQAKRAVRKNGNQCFMVVVRKMEDELPAGSDSATPVGTATQSTEPECPDTIPDDKLKALLDKYKHRFSMDLPELPQHRGPAIHTIPLYRWSQVRRSHQSGATA